MDFRDEWVETLVLREGAGFVAYMNHLGTYNKGSNERSWSKDNEQDFSLCKGYNHGIIIWQTFNRGDLYCDVLIDWVMEIELDSHVTTYELVLKGYCDQNFHLRVNCVTYGSDFPSSLRDEYQKQSSNIIMVKQKTVGYILMKIFNTLKANWTKMHV